ncbi:MAG: ABC transporter substrate-binding protein [Pelagibacterales bacterium]|nr:ABC transporter substrate-binding protein [Pelagibacterales bacterium]
MKKFIQFIIFTFIGLILNIFQSLADEKIKIGLVVPLSGEYKEVGNSILKSARLAINKIDDLRIEIIPRDTKSNPEITLRVSKELYKQGIKIIIGPVFNKNLIYLDELNEVTFLSLSNTNINNPKNVISGGINAISQINAIKKFQEFAKLERSILLIPNSEFKNEIEDAVKKTKIKLKDKFIYNSDPTILTSQIEKLTRYPQRKQNLKDEIKRLENSNEANKEKKISNLKKRDTLGGVNFDSVIIADFDESLKSVTTSLLYTDITSDRVNYITLNQWFDKSILKEKNIQPIYFPSINKENYDNFVSEYFNIYNEYPNQISFLSFDLVGLIYFLIYKNDFVINDKIFYKKNKFKGKIGIFEINKNKISHILNFYVAENNNFKKIF